VSEWICPDCDLPGDKHPREPRCRECHKINKRVIDRAYAIRSGRIDPDRPRGRPPTKSKSLEKNRQQLGFSELSQKYLNAPLYRFGETTIEHQGDTRAFKRDEA
jgi:hypothetical protein